jgi:hypothetical protein
MSEDPTARAERFVSSTKGQWTELVHLALDHRYDRKRLAASLARLSQSNKETIRRKLAAIDRAARCGIEKEAIIERGQSVILGQYLKKNGLHEPKEFIRHRVSKRLAEGWRDDVVTRLMKVCELETSDDLFEFLCSLILGMDDLELRHHAGMMK